MVEERVPASPDHVVAGVEDFARRPDKSHKEGKLEVKEAGEETIRGKEDGMKSESDDHPDLDGNIVPTTSSTTLNGNEYAAIESGSESDFGEAPSWLKASGGAGGDGGLLDRMFSQEYVQLSLEDADDDDDVDVLRGGSGNLAESKSLSEIRRNLFPDESLSSSTSSSTTHGDKKEDRRSRSRPTSLQSSIDNIREEASRVDAAVALHRLETVQLELDETRRQLHNRRQELEEQRAVIRLKDDRLATLELERDLYKADARVRSASKPGGYWRRDRSVTSASTGSGSEASRSHIPTILERHHRPPLHEESSSCLSSKASEHVVPSPSSSDSSSDSSSSTDSSSANRGNRLSDSNLRRASALEAKCLVGTKRLASILISRRKREKDGHQRQDARTDATAQLSSVGPSHFGSTIPNSKKPAASIPEEWIQNQQSLAGLLEEQVEELQNRLRASMETADELRKRLASIHGFYERTIRTLQQERYQASEERLRHQLQHRHAETGQEWRAKLDHVKQAKKRAIAALEAKLREKDDEIERLSTLAYDEI
jgi:hypothetical protein